MKDKIFIITIVVLLCLASYFLINNTDKLKSIDILEKNIEECKNNCSIEISSNEKVINDIINVDKTDDSVSNSIDDNCFSYISGILDLGEENMIQNGMYVCAKNLSSKQYYCTSEIIKNYNNSNKRGYELIVPIGTYQLAGIYPHSIDSNYPLKEFKHSRCSFNGVCEELLISFTVSCNERKENINLNNSGLTEIFKNFNIYKK
ncbi:MAG: hypothetical protein PHZ07_03800 [Patescibacteria group bacterium]|nr:hypothetical protein [Patescibacteria group bacterium]MDD4304555.1 hypothetical protein [Patescibacteria group bacterium]MDD4695742.1 hypothetical protein [Patescibacteria group bacterium]